MATKSVYQPEPAIVGDRVTISGDEHRHLSVARVEVGEGVEIFDGKGSVWAIEVTSTGRRETAARVVSRRQVARETVELILGLALIRPAAFEWALEKVVEVGVTRIVPVVAERSNVAPGKRSDRWTRIVVEAAKQAKRYWLPVVDSPLSFANAVNIEATARIMFAERGGGEMGLPRQASAVLFLVGPEGGWTDAEMDAARDRGFVLAGLGTGILKSETAAIVGAALIRHELERTV